MLRKSISWPVWQLARPRLKLFLRSLSSPERAQEKVLCETLKLIGPHSEWGRRLKIDGDVASYSRFVDRVPVTTYDDYRPLIDRWRNQGSHPIAYRGTVRWTSTSGTTDNAKWLPVTGRSLGAHLDDMLVWSLALCRDESEHVFGKAMWLKSGANQGHIANLIGDRWRRWVRLNQLPSVEPFDEVEQIVRWLSRSDLTMLVAINPATICVQLDQVRQNPDLFADRLRRIGASDRIEPLAWALANDFRKFWPRLRCIATWTGGPLAHYISILGKAFPQVRYRDLGLIASEGRLTLPLAFDTSYGVAAIHSSMIELGREDSSVGPIPLWEAREGEEYVMIVTNRQGLLRYRLGDVVRTGPFIGSTPTFTFLRREGDMSTLVGEKLCPDQVSLVFTRKNLQRVALAPFPASISEPAYYSLVGESSADASMAPVVDQELASVNEEYRSRRSSKRLGPVRWIRVRQGFFDHIRSSRGVWKPSLFIRDHQLLEKWRYDED